ncbi:MAG TPA: hypothetical protein VFW58_01585 [Trichococcus sp.]|nr:hypothetical protein [Trichococcus sp.]
MIDENTKGCLENEAAFGVFGGGWDPERWINESYPSLNVRHTPKRWIKKNNPSFWRLAGNEKMN